MVFGGGNVGVVGQNLTAYRRLGVVSPAKPVVDRLPADAQLGGD